MKHVVVVLVFLAWSAGYGQAVVRVSRETKRIQLDGALIEWNADNARQMDVKQPLLFDVVHTPEGLTGYIRYPRLETCSTWTVKVYPDIAVLKTWKAIDFSMDAPEAGWYAVYAFEDDRQQMVAAEWVLPWDSLALDSAGEYSVGLIASSACGDTLPARIISGNRPVQEETGLFGGAITPGILGQLLTIGILLAVFVVMKMRISANERRRKEMKKEREL